MSDSIVIIEPLAFGSRLQLLSYFCEALLEDSRQITVVVAQEADATDYWKELMGDVEGSINVITTPKIKLRDSYQKLTFLEVLALADEIKKIGKTNPNQDVLFAASDDYFVNAYWPVLAAKMYCCGNIHVVRYRAEETIFSSGMYLGYLLRKLILKVLRLISRNKIIVFDERVSHKYAVLPDPWNKKSTAEEVAGSKNNGIFISDKKLPLSYALMIGRQDKRKGIEFFIDWLQKAESLPLSILIIGSIPEEYIEKFSCATARHEENIIHIENFVSEHDMLLAFKNAKLILMPYHPCFKSSSGVLAHAVAFEKPVVSTDHGLVGYRVMNRNLGSTVAYGDVGSLVRVLDENEYEKFFDKKSCRDFSKEIDLNSFKRKVKEVLK